MLVVSMLFEEESKWKKYIIPAAAIGGTGLLGYGLYNRYLSPRAQALSKYQELARRKEVAFANKDSKAFDQLDKEQKDVEQRYFIDQGENLGGGPRYNPSF